MFILYPLFLFFFINILSSFLIFDLNYYGLLFILTLFQLNCMMCSYARQISAWIWWICEMLIQYSGINCFYKLSVFVHLYTYIFQAII